MKTFRDEKQRLVSFIKKYRADNKLSQAALGAMLGLTQARIWQVEKADPASFELLFGILSRCGYDVDLQISSKLGDSNAVRSGIRSCIEGRSIDQCDIEGARRGDIRCDAIE